MLPDAYIFLGIVSFQPPTFMSDLLKIPFYNGPGDFGIHLRPRRWATPKDAIEPIIGIRSKKSMSKNIALCLS